MNILRLFRNQAMASAMVLLLGLGLTVTPSDLSADDSSPKYGQYWGRVESLDVKSNTVVIGDRIFQVAPNAPVHRLAGNAALSIGNAVEFNITANSDSNTAGTITELWIVGAKGKK
jgi:hypothetical protein